MKLRNKLDKKNLNSKKEKKTKTKLESFKLQFIQTRYYNNQTRKVQKKVKLDITKFQTRKQ